MLFRKLTISFGVLILTFASSKVFAQPKPGNQTSNHSATTAVELKGEPQVKKRGNLDSVADVAISKVLQFLNSPDLVSFSNTCDDLRRVSAPERAKRNARYQIQRLVGPFITLEPGKFEFGPSPGEN